MSTNNHFSSKFRLECFLFFKILKEFNSRCIFPHGIFRRIFGPNEFLSSTKTLISKCHSSVNDVFAISTNHHKSSIGIMSNGLRIHFTGSHILDGQGQPFTILDLRSVTGNRFQIGLLNLTMFSINDLSRGIHGHGRFFPSKLDQD